MIYLNFARVFSDYHPDALLAMFCNGNAIRNFAYSKNRPLIRALVKYNLNFKQIHNEKF